MSWLSDVNDFLSDGYGPELVGGVAAGLVAVLTVELTHRRSQGKARRGRT